MRYLIDDVEVTIASDGRQAYFNFNGMHYRKSTPGGDMTDQEKARRITALLSTARLTILNVRGVDPQTIEKDTPVYKQYFPVRVK